MNAVDKWLDQWELTRLEQARDFTDLDGWRDSAPCTFDSGLRLVSGVPTVDGDVTDEDRRIAAGIRERVRTRRGN
jgi:hypothetical protein